jgi:hypothetical protein
MGACVRIDIGRLQARLSAEQRRALSASDVHAWLAAVGFKFDGDWHCDGAALPLLRPDEIRAMWTSETIDHVTYVERNPPKPQE